MLELLMRRTFLASLFASKQWQAKAPVSAPAALSPAQLQLVSGGSPRGTWQAEGLGSPRGTWQSASAASSPRGTW
jgi:hypothetical protein